MDVMHAMGSIDHNSHKVYISHLHDSTHVHHVQIMCIACRVIGLVMGRLASRDYFPEASQRTAWLNGTYAPLTAQR